MSTYAWVIDRDHLAEQDEDSEAGTTGPSDASEELLARLSAGDGEPFKMRDGDGELYYTGRIVGADTDNEDGFAPLQDFGMPNAGCTGIEYKRGNSWEAL